MLFTLWYVPIAARVALQGVHADTSTGAFCRDPLEFHRIEQPPMQRLLNPRALTSANAQSFFSCLPPGLLS
jgi:hypothetical protein